MAQKCKILVVGQTPPPFGGQAIMIQKMLDSHYENAELYHVRMAFSREMDEAGRFKLHKLYELVRVIFGIFKSRIVKKADILYYPPSGPQLIPVLRDIVILLSTRWMFRKIIFHFHAGGLTDLYGRLPRFIKPLFRLAFYKPDIGIKLSPFSPPDPENVQAKKVFVVPNGIDDCSLPFFQSRLANRRDFAKILFVGVVSETKGIMVLLEACRILHRKGLLFELDIVGQFESSEFEEAVRDFVVRHGLEGRVRFKGVLLGQVKWKAYASADIFCFPTFAPFENFSVVLLEAMSFGLSIVTTKWRGIPSVVDEKCAFVVPIRNPQAVAEKLETLILNPDLRSKMGEYGRKRFLEHFTIDKFYQRMDRVFKAVAEEDCQ